MRPCLTHVSPTCIIDKLTVLQGALAIENAEN